MENKTEEKQENLEPIITYKVKPHNKYKPHQSERECARRIRQMNKNKVNENV